MIHKNHICYKLQDQEDRKKDQRSSVESQNHMGALYDIHPLLQRLSEYYFFQVKNKQPISLDAIRACKFC